MKCASPCHASLLQLSRDGTTHKGPYHTTPRESRRPLASRAKCKLCPKTLYLLWALYKSQQHEENNLLAFPTKNQSILETTRFCFCRAGWGDGGVILKKSNTRGRPAKSLVDRRGKWQQRTSRCPCLSFMDYETCQHFLSTGLRKCLWLKGLMGRKSKDRQCQKVSVLVRIYSYEKENRPLFEGFARPVRKWT